MAPYSSFPHIGGRHVYLFCLSICLSVCLSVCVLALYFRKKCAGQFTSVRLLPRGTFLDQLKIVGWTKISQTLWYSKVQCCAQKVLSLKYALINLINVTYSGMVHIRSLTLTRPHILKFAKNFHVNFNLPNYFI